MIFNSLPFLIFLPLCLLLYYALPHRYRWGFMLLARYIFYGCWKVEYLGLIAFSTIVDYSVGRFLESSEHQFKRKLALTASIFTNLGLLFFFKYFNWFLEDVANPLGFIPDNAYSYWKQHFNILLPVGISFYTFQTLGYTIDVYKKQVQAERNIFKFALFVSYFPQLVAGPIERFKHLKTQLFTHHSFTYENLQHGGRFMLYGLFIKMCVADNIANTVDQVFNDISSFDSFQLLQTMLLFGVQIFSDFHGYSLIAIGVARLFGVQLMANFNSPYTSLSIREFWSRWHISLSIWFRDYIFIPIGGSRVNQVRWTINILIVFIVSGIWHGANFTFFAWGAIHGLAYIIEKFTWNRLRTDKLLIKLLKWTWTMSIVCIAWVFFRSDSIEVATQFLQHMISGSEGHSDLIFPSFAISFLGLLIVSDIVFRDNDVHTWLGKQRFIIRWSIYSFMIVSILGFAGTVNHPFIYFQF
jgi:alginate O-acetyltransferase complex protein AlgI